MKMDLANSSSGEDELQPVSSLTRVYLKVNFVSINTNEPYVPKSFDISTCIFWVSLAGASSQSERKCKCVVGVCERERA